MPLLPLPLPLPDHSLPHPYLCSGQWQVALETYQRMQQAGCQPNSFVFAALIRTLGRSRRWRQAAAVYEVSWLGVLT